MSAEPLTRDEREARMASEDLHDAIDAEQDWYREPWVRRYEATVQAVEAERDALALREYAITKERDTLARRVEALRVALEDIARVDVGGLQSIDEYVYDEKENRYESVKHLLSRVSHRRKTAMAALAADDAARGEA